MKTAARFKQRLHAGESLVGHMIIEFTGRGTAKMLEAAGADFAMIDLEHSAITIEQVADLVAWLRATPVAPLVRVPQVPWVSRVLDVGAAGIMAPDVKDAAHAAALVHAMKYAPQGNRGAFFGGANTSYEAVKAPAFMAEANAGTTLICQIESRSGVEHCEAIAATPGVDVLWIGHFDLSISLGIPGEFEAKEFAEAFRHVAAMARKHRRVMGVQPRNVAQAQLFASYGANLFSYSADFSVYQDALAKGVSDLRGVLGSR
jgi:2-keto-3-deoxy-L-rhamnonate aldolase RhmA